MLKLQLKISLIFLYTKTMTPLRLLENTDVVYSISCSECNLFYIGEHLETFPTESPHTEVT